MIFQLHVKHMSTYLHLGDATPRWTPRNYRKFDPRDIPRDTPEYVIAS